MRILLAISLFLLLSACGEEEATQVRVENGWIAEIPPVIKVTLALMTLLNDSEQPKYLVGATSAKAEYIEIHRSIVVDDLARMVRQTEVEIPPRGSIEFNNETGYHLMFYGVEEIKEGQKIPVTLKFKDGSVLTSTYNVLDRRKVEVVTTD